MMYNIYVNIIPIHKLIYNICTYMYIYIKREGELYTHITKINDKKEAINLKKSKEGIWEGLKRGGKGGEMMPLY